MIDLQKRVDAAVAKARQYAQLAKESVEKATRLEDETRRLLAENARLREIIRGLQDELTKRG